MFKKLLAVLALTVAPVIGLASERGTADEASAMVDRAVTLYEEQGMEALVGAVSDPANNDFRDRDLYVFVGELDGNMVAHGANAALVGRDLDGLKDASGKLLIVELKKMARDQGDGWVDYVWPNPSTKKIESKSTRVVRLGDGHYAGVGIYTE